MPAANNCENDQKKAFTMTAVTNWGKAGVRSKRQPSPAEAAGLLGDTRAHGCPSPLASNGMAKAREKA